MHAGFRDINTWGYRVLRPQEILLLEAFQACPLLEGMSDDFHMFSVRNGPCKLRQGSGFDLWGCVP